MYVNTALFNLYIVQINTSNLIIQDNAISLEVSKQFFDMF